MRFYDPSSNPPERFETETLFPRCTEEQAAIKCVKLGMAPSVTTVLDVVREDYLEEWKIRECIKSGREQPDAHPQEIVTEFKSAESPNAKFGTDCHALMEAWMRGEAMEAEPLVAKHTAPLLAWLNENVVERIATEVTLVSKELKSAGTVDMVFRTKAGKLVVGDLKVVKFSQKFPPHPGLAYKMQLSAYTEFIREAMGLECERISFYLASPFGWDRAPDIRIFPHTKCYLPAFRNARALWEEKLTQEHPNPINPASTGAPTFDPASFKRK